MRFHRPTALLTRPSVTVVIPCYRYGQFLPTAVGSALEQSGVDVEVIIVDDASGDDSVEVARRLAANDSRVKVIAHEFNQGHIQTYNDGLKAASGDYVVLLSADDALAHDSLPRAVALMEAHPEVGFVYGHSKNFSDRIPTVSDHVRSWSTWDGRSWLERMCRRAENVVMTPEVVMRRDAWEQIGGYDPSVPHAADMLVWLSTATRWDIGRVNGEAQAFYRVHGDNMHLTTYSGMLRDLQEQRQVFALLFSGNHSPSADARLEQAARRAMARRALRLAAAERRNGNDDAIVDDYLDFAASTSPKELATPRWRLQVAGDRLLDSTPAAPLKRVHTHLTWRRWRRYGI